MGPKHVEIRQYINKIEIVTSVGFYSIFYSISLYYINRLVFIAETECVYCAVRTGSLNIIRVAKEQHSALFDCYCRFQQNWATCCTHNDTVAVLTGFFFVSVPCLNFVIP